MVFLQNLEPFLCLKNVGSPTKRTRQHQITKVTSVTFFQNILRSSTNHSLISCGGIWFTKKFGNLQDNSWVQFQKSFKQCHQSLTLFSQIAFICSIYIFRIFDEKIFCCYMLRVTNNWICFTCSINSLIKINRQCTHIFHINQYCRWRKEKICHVYKPLRPMAKNSPCNSAM